MLISHRPTRTQRQIEQDRRIAATLVVRGADGRPLCGARVLVEQQTHAFPFACVIPEIGDLSERDQTRYLSRLREVFNGTISERQAGSTCASGADAVVFEVAHPVHLGSLRRDLDRLAAAGRRVELHLCGRSARAEQEAGDCCDPLHECAFACRVAELYTLCFSHQAVAAIVWKGFSNRDPRAHGGGLLRTDLAPRHAHKLLRKLIGTVWHTRDEGVTDPHGRFRFRGFPGDYRVAVRLGDSPARVQYWKLEPSEP